MGSASLNIWGPWMKQMDKLLATWGCLVVKARIRAMEDPHLGSAK